MDSPCHFCVAPDRYPGCHDHCEKLREFHESDEYKKLCEYKNTYLKNQVASGSAILDKRIRRIVQKGHAIHSYKYLLKR